jgi:hypothetical protein
MTNTRIPWNKGKKLTEEHRKKLSKARLGKAPWNKGIPCSEETKQKLQSVHKERAVYGSEHPLWKPPSTCVECGVKTSANRYKYCIKCRSVKKPKLNPLRLFPKCKDCGKRLSAKSAKRCRHCAMATPERKKLQSELAKKRVGEKHPKWIKDKTNLKRFSEEEKLKRSSAYKFWARSVKDRDGWSCVVNNDDCNGRLESHHIKSYTYYPDSRYDIDNGVCLCRYHHRLAHKNITENHVYIVQY